MSRRVCSAGLSGLGESRVRLSMRLLVLASQTDPGLLVDPDWQQALTSLQVCLVKGKELMSSVPGPLMDELRRIEMGITR